MSWQRPLGALRYCSVSGNAGGSTLTLCKGRWAEGELVERSSSPLPAERCGRCAVELGLIELATAAVTPATTFGELFVAEVEAFHTHMDAKEAELDRYGYGGSPTRAKGVLPWVPFGVASDFDCSDTGGE